MQYAINKAIVIPVVLLAWLITGYSDTGASASDKPVASLKVYKQKKNGEFEEMRKGEIIQGQEKYSVGFKTESPAYVYIFQRDVTCRLVSLFPNQEYSDATNPVTANKDYYTKWISLNGATGQTTLVLLAYKKELKNPESVCKYKMNACTRGVAGTHKPKEINMNILEIREMRLEFQ